MFEVFLFGAGRFEFVEDDVAGDSLELDLAVFVVVHEDVLCFFHEVFLFGFSFVDEVAEVFGVREVEPGFFFHVAVAFDELGDVLGAVWGFVEHEGGAAFGVRQSGVVGRGDVPGEQGLLLVDVVEVGEHFEGLLGVDVFLVGVAGDLEQRARFEALADDAHQLVADGLLSEDGVVEVELFLVAVDFGCRLEPFGRERLRAGDGFVVRGGFFGRAFVELLEDLGGSALFLVSEEQLVFFREVFAGCRVRVVDFWFDVEFVDGEVEVDACEELGFF